MARSRRDATADDLAALPDDARVEVVGGEIVQRAIPSFEHGATQVSVGALLRPYGRSGAGGPGGWWIASEVEVEYEVHEVYLSDVAGWRRDRHTQRPSGRPVRSRPDWVCEILSPSTASRDLVEKLRTFQRCGVDHYWVIDPERLVLTVYRWQSSGYVVALVARAGETVRAEPFDAVEIAIDELFGIEPD